MSEGSAASYAIEHLYEQLAEPPVQASTSASAPRPSPPTSLTFQEREANQDELSQIEHQTEQLQQQMEDIPMSQRRLGYDSAAAASSASASSDSRQSAEPSPARQSAQASRVSQAHLVVWAAKTHSAHYSASALCLLMAKSTSP